jgi:hypothetical protein
MSVVNNNLLLTTDAGVSQYQISRSLRFNTPDSAYANRTFGTPTTQGTFTLAMWVKRAALSTAQSLFGVSTNHSFGFTTGNALNLTFGGTSALTTTAVFRDTSAWYHIVWTQSGTSHTVYVNGTSQGTATATSSVFNTAVAHQVGASNTANYFNGYLAEIYFIDGQALTPSSFTETNATTGQLVPKAYTGTYGTNGFRLNFSDNSAATLYTLGADSRTDGALNGNNGSLVNGPTYSSANGGSIVFDGSNDYVSLPNLGMSPSGARTFSIWMKASSIASIRTLMGFGNIGAGLQSNLLHISAVSTGDIYWGFNNADFYTAGNVINTSQYYHICCTYNGGALNTSNVSIYINGVSQSLSAAGALIGSTANTTNSNYQISGDNGIRFFPGNIPQASIYNRVLSAAEVSQNYNALVGRFGGTSTGSIVTDGMVLNLDAGNTASYPGTGTTWTDISLRKNNWTPNNLSVTAGSGNDSLTDTPTSYGTDSSGAGGVVRGNYATLNPLSTLTTVTLANGNLDYSSTTTSRTAIATIGVSSGTWYWEVATTAGTTETQVGVYGTSASTLFSLAANSTVYGIRFNADTGALDRTSDGVTFTSIATGLTSGPYFPYFNNNGTTAKVVSVNFGQRPFAYAAPSGFKALCDTNISEGSITTSGTFTGNANADGPFVYLNGVPTAMTINSNAVTFATHADKLANGFKLRSSSASYNTAGTNTYSITTTGAKFKYARAQPNP